MYLDIYLCRYYYIMDGIVQVEEPLFASVTSPFIFSEFDVNYHRQAVGQVRTNELTLSGHVTTMLISDWLG